MKETLASPSAVLLSESLGSIMTLALTRSQWPKTNPLGPGPLWLSRSRKDRSSSIWRSSFWAFCLGESKGRALIHFCITDQMFGTGDLEERSEQDLAE